MNNITIQNNPFFILKITCDASRRDVMEAAENLSFVLDSETCSDAQNALINPAKRLSAEIDWFIDLDNNLLEKIRENVADGKEISTDGLTSLSRLNATVYNCSLIQLCNDLDSGLDDDSLELGYAILDIDDQFSNLSILEITASINSNHTKAKLGVVSEQDVGAELKKKRDSIRQMFTEKLSALDEDDYAQLITILVENCIVPEDYDDGVVISDAVDQYELRMQSFLELNEESIRNQIDSIKNNNFSSSLDSSIDTLIESVKDWYYYVWPLYIKAQHRGMPSKTIESIGWELRDLSLYLHNEKKETESALAIVDAAKTIFTNFTNLYDVFKSDSETLGKLLEEEKEFKTLESYINDIKNFAEQLANNSVKHKDGTIHETDEDAILFFRDVYLMFHSTLINDLNLDDETKEKARLTVCAIARNTAIELHNKHGKTKYALIIAEALVEYYSDLSSISKQLKEDCRILQEQYNIINNPYVRLPNGLYVDPIRRTVVTPQNTSVSSPTKSNSNQQKIPTSTSSASKSEQKDPAETAWTVIIAIALSFFLIWVCTKLLSTNSKSEYSSTPTAVPTERAKATCKVMLDSDGGVGGYSFVTVTTGESMPYATAPSKDGYDFKGYYADKYGFGTQYYDSNMNGVHTWDQYDDTTLYAYWTPKIESKYTSSMETGKDVYVDVISIFPKIGIYTEFEGGTGVYNKCTGFVCRCKTTGGQTVWVSMSTLKYKSDFDADTSTRDALSSVTEITFDTPQRIHGTTMSAEKVISGLTSDTGPIVISYSYTS